MKIRVNLKSGNKYFVTTKYKTYEDMINYIMIDNKDDIHLRRFKLAKDEGYVNNIIIIDNREIEAIQYIGEYDAII